MLQLVASMASSLRGRPRFVGRVSAASARSLFDMLGKLSRAIRCDFVCRDAGHSTDAHDADQLTTDRAMQSGGGIWKGLRDLNDAEGEADDVEDFGVGFVM